MDSSSRRAGVVPSSLTTLEAAGFVLCLEGVHDSELVSFLEGPSYPDPTPVGPVAVWPKQPYYHPTATRENLEGLAQFVTTTDVECLAYHAALDRDQALILEPC